MKKALFSLLLTFIVAHAFPQTQVQNNSTTPELIGKIISVVGLKPNFEIRASNVPNAAAVVSSGKRYILYNPNFIAGLIKLSGNEWSAVSVLAHEIGHHLNGHTLDNHGSVPGEELEADEFSGFVLKRMGASLDDAQVATKMAADARGTATHPGQRDRLVAIERGWNNANNQLLGKVDLEINKPKLQPGPAVELESLKTQNVLDEKYIAANVYFNADSKGKYFVTTRLNLVKVQDNQLFLIGKVSPLKSTDFPLLIHDEDEKTQLFVDAAGTIVTPKGKKVGRLEMH